MRRRPGGRGPARDRPRVAFVRLVRQFLALGLGFAAGATMYLVLTEFVPEALEAGANLPRDGKQYPAAGLAAGVLLILPLLFV